RLYGGQVRNRERLRLYRLDDDGSVSVRKGQVTSLKVVGHPDSDRLTPGNIAEIGGLPAARVGDRLDPDELDPTDDGHRFPPPSLETVVRAKHSDQTTDLRSALVALADQDPLIRTRMLPDGETSLLLYGEVQKEVIAATLEAEYGIEAFFEPSRTVYFERPRGTGEAADAFTWFGANVALRVEPGPRGSGIVYRLGTERGTLREAFHHALEDAVRRTLEQGLYGWNVTDCVVTITHARYRTGSVAGDFRNLGPILVMRALAAAGTAVYEPCETFELQLPPDTVGTVIAELVAAEASIVESAGDGTTWTLRGDIPSRRVQRFRQRLPGLTSGEGAWWGYPEGDRLVVGDPPVRPRVGSDPLDVEEYLRFLAKRGLPW
ncbi:MAG TPA: GTP-binding protein, partial [Actinopolymorphaceae bacterium]